MGWIISDVHPHRKVTNLPVFIGNLNHIREEEEGIKEGRAFQQLMTSLTHPSAINETCCEVWMFTCCYGLNACLLVLNWWAMCRTWTIEIYMKHYYIVSAYAIFNALIAIIWRDISIRTLCKIAKSSLNVSKIINFNWMCRLCYMLLHLWNDQCNNLKITRLPSLFLEIHIVCIKPYAYPENPEEAQVIVNWLNSMNMGYDVYPTMPGIELVTLVDPIVWLKLLNLCLRMSTNWHLIRYSIYIPLIWNGGVEYFLNKNRGRENIP